MRFLLAFTIGLLAFLGIDALLEGTELAGTGPEALGARGSCGSARRAPTSPCQGSSWLGGRRERLGAAGAGRPGTGLGYHAAFLVALGIGLHNLGEGLAIGSAHAIGSLALGATLVVGFALHNTTEGLAIVAPVARDGRAQLGRLVELGVLAGAPAVIGAWIGASAFHPSLAALVFGIGAGRSPRWCPDRAARP